MFGVVVGIYEDAALVDENAAVLFVVKEFLVEEFVVSLEKSSLSTILYTGPLG